MTFAMTELAFRPVRTGAAVRMSLVLLAVVAGVSVGRALLAREAAPASGAPVLATATTEAVCPTDELEIDEGYGVRGSGSRKICL